MAELFHGEKEHSDWFPKWYQFCYMEVAKMDHSWTDFIDIQKKAFWGEVETLSLLSDQKHGKISAKLG